MGVREMVGDVVPDGERLIKRWLDGNTRLEQARTEVVRAEGDLTNAARELAAWMLPEDAKPGEKIAVWFGDSLIQVEVSEKYGPDAKITVRKRGRKLHAAA